MPYPGQPKDTPIPSELDRWNWGAFLLNWIWGLGNSTYIALLMFVPLVNVIMIFVLGAKGNKWAWKNRLWENEEHFVRTQRNWARAGFAIIIGFIVLIAPLFYLTNYLLTNSEAYKLSLDKAITDQRVIEVMGEPIQPSWLISGNIKSSSSSGFASLSIPITGPSCEGNIVSRSKKKEGEWEVSFLMVKFECKSDNIILINTDNIVIPKVGVDT